MSIEQTIDLNHNQDELKAIKKLEAAFKACAKLGIRFTVMSNDLMFANKRLYAEASKIAKIKETVSSGAYTTIGYCQEADISISVDVNTHGSMDSCGGW